MFEEERSDVVIEGVLKEINSVKTVFDQEETVTLTFILSKESSVGLRKLFKLFGVSGFINVIGIFYKEEV